MIKQILLALLLGATSLPLLAANYYVVIPSQAKGAVAPTIAVALNSVPLPDGMVAEVYPGFDFNTALSVTGDPSFSSTGVAWSLSSGELPAGLMLSPDGTVSGTPTAPQSSAFHVQASYKTKTGEQAYEILVGEITVALASATAPAGKLGFAYSFDLRPLLTLSGKAGLDPAQAVWAVTGGVLPSGLVLNPEGTVSGTPSSIQTESFQVSATYATRSGEQTYTVAIDATGYLLPNGVTVRCTGMADGEEFELNGKTYRVVHSPEDAKTYAANACTSNMTDMSGMSFGSTFNENISHWDTANVTDMYYMFESANAFNQPIGDWDTSKVTSMFNMFADTNSFNQEICNWNVGAVTDIGSGASFNIFSSLSNANAPKFSTEPTWGSNCP